MDISMIIDVAVLAILVLFALAGFIKGTYKSIFSLIWKAGLFAGIYFAVPALMNLGFKFIPADALSSIEEYVDEAFVKEFAAGLIRVFLSGILWLLLCIILKPLSAIICSIFRKIIFRNKVIEDGEEGETKRERKKRIKKAKKHKALWSRLVGLAVNTVTGALTISLLLGPLAGAVGTLRDENGETRCITYGSINTCEYTSYYTDSNFAKIMSTADFDKKVFKALSTMRVGDSKIVLADDLDSILDIYFLLIDKGADFSGNVDAIKILSSLQAQDIRDIGSAFAGITLLTTLIEEAGYKVIEKKLDLPDTIDLSEISITDEIQNVFNIVAKAADLPIFEDGKLTSHYYNVLVAFDDTFVDEFVDEIENSELIDQLYETYLVPKFDELVEKAISKLGGNKAVTISTEGVTLGNELRSMLKALAKISSTGIVKQDADGNYELSASGTDIVKNLNEAKVNEMIDAIFTSKLFEQVVGSIAEPFMLKYANELSGEELTSEDLDLENISWKSELKSIVSFALEASNDGILDDLSGGEKEPIDAFFGKDEAVITALGNKIGDSKIMTSIIPAIIEPALESAVESIVPAGEKVIPDDVDYKSEITNLLLAGKMLYDSGVLDESSADGDKTSAVLDLLKVDANIDKLYASEVIYSVVTKIITDKVNNFDFDGSISHNSTEDFTKEDWTSETKLLVNALDDTESVSVFGDIGSMNPADTETAVKIEPLGNIVENLLKSKIFGDGVTAKVNDLLDSTGEDPKTKEELTDPSVSWTQEFVVVNKVLYEFGAGDSGSVDGITDFDTSNSSDFGTVMNNVTVALDDSKIFGPVVTNKIKGMLKDVFVAIDIDDDPATTTNVSFVDDMVLSEIDWETELSIKDEFNGILPLVDIEISTSTISALFGTGGTFEKVGNSVLVTSLINSNDIPTDKKIPVPTWIQSNVEDAIDDMAVSDAGKAAIRKIINYYEI